MARNIHRTLDYEKKEVDVAMAQLRLVSDICYTLSENGVDLGGVWTWGNGMSFNDLTKPEYEKIRGLLPNIGRFDKESDKWGLSLIGQIKGKDVVRRNYEKTRYPVFVTIKFQWDVPDTCEVKTIEVTEPIGDKNKFHVGEDGQMYQTKLETRVECNKPVLESVFNSE